jgi:hypothetical protein
LQSPRRDVFGQSRDPVNWGPLSAILKGSRPPGRQAGRKDLPNISKESLGFSKFFQGFLWPFCEISKACKGKKEKKSSSKFFRSEAATKREVHFPTFGR